ncbi:MAG: hypothetical protein JNL70_01855 [Saprospiraceae bacterium]|nr:hypothetical protein [Saprospiraceae bacterium]
MGVITEILPKKKAETLKFPQSKLLTFKDYARLTMPDNSNYERHNKKTIFTASSIESHPTVAFN